MEKGKNVIVEEALVIQILESMGVQSFDRGVVSQLLEVMHSYSDELLYDAHIYAIHAGRKTTDVNDLKLALQMRSLITTTPSREVLQDNYFQHHHSPVHLSLRK